MKQYAKFIYTFLVVALMILAFPGRALAQGPSGDDSPVIFGSDYVLAQDQVIKDLVVFGGNATLETGSTVTGDVVIFGGKLVVSGEVRGSVTTFGGAITITDSAMIGGDLNTLGGKAQISSKAVVRGNRLSGGSNIPFSLPTKIYTPSFWVDFGSGAGILSAVLASIILAMVAAMVALFLPQPTDRVAQTIGTQPIISGAVGLLTLVIVPALFLVLAITVILIPLGVIGLLVFAIALLFGWVGVGLAFGKRLATLFHAQWSIPVSAIIGTLLLNLFANLILVFSGAWFWTLCCIGIPLFGLLSMVGLGGVVASRFGAQVYNPNRPFAAQPPAQPQGPLPPANWPPQQPIQGYGQPPIQSYPPYSQPTIPPAPPSAPQPPEPPVPPVETSEPPQASNPSEPPKPEE